MNEPERIKKELNKVIILHFVNVILIKKFDFCKTNLILGLPPLPTD
jgi:hypothetical protein